MHYRRKIAENLEKERVQLNMSQSEFANSLGISVSSYKRLISCETSKLDIDMIERLYSITGKLLFEYYGESSRHLDLVAKIKKLNKEQMDFIEYVIDREIANG